MKILKQGDLDAAERKKKLTRFFVCEYCGCEFEANRDEYHDGNPVDYDGSTSVYCNCPCCKALTFSQYKR